MGRLPPEPLPPGGPGPHLPGRLRRASGGRRDQLLGRPALGRLGEDLACRFLASHGLQVVATNVRVGRGEIDILALDHGVRVAVEVRTSRGREDPVDAADPGKRRRASRLAWQAGARRFDVIGVGVGDGVVEFHWVPGVF
ncbi:MAG: YraN family protein [Actinomycetes bacterium]